MTDSQEEKIKKIFASHGVKTKDILEKMFPQGKGSYYNELKRERLSVDFTNGIKSNFGIDLVKELEEYNKKTQESEDVKNLKIQALERENELLRKLIDMYEGKKKEG